MKGLANFFSRARQGLKGTVSQLNSRSSKFFKLYEKGDHASLVKELKGMSYARYESCVHPDSGLTLL